MDIKIETARGTVLRGRVVKGRIKLQSDDGKTKVDIANSNVKCRGGWYAWRYPEHPEIRCVCPGKVGRKKDLFETIPVIVK